MTIYIKKEIGFYYNNTLTVNAVEQSKQNTGKCLMIGYNN